MIKEGDVGNIFYMVIEGSAKATKIIEGNPKDVMKYEIGDYFGELALLKNEPRAATVLAESDLILVLLDRPMFKRLMGPLEEILKRNMEIYNQFASK